LFIVVESNGRTIVLLEQASTGMEVYLHPLYERSLSKKSLISYH